MGFDYEKRTTTKINDHPVGKLLDSLRMESAFFTNSMLRQPWAMGMPPMPNCMMFHLVLECEAWFQSNGQAFCLKVSLCYSQKATVMSCLMGNARL